MKTLLLSAAILGLAPAVRAQSLIHTFEGDSDWDRLGHGVAGPGDLTGDGVPEILVASPGDSSRLVRAYDGNTGVYLWSLNGHAIGDGFGEALDAVGDIDGDSVGDFVIGAPAGGYAQLFSGASHTVIHEWTIPVGCVAGVGDVDGDNFGDVAITGGGHLRVYSGATHTLIHDITGPTPWFGGALSDAGDCNGDGYADIIVGDYWSHTGIENGDAWVYSGVDGSVMHHWSGPDYYHWFGDAVAGIGDVNGDGMDDVCVTARIEYLFSYDNPYVNVYSGADGSLIHHIDTIENTGLWGNSACGVGDVDGDGAGDFMLAYNGAWVGDFIELHSGATGELIYSFDGGQVSDQSLELAGDLDGDSAPEVISGAEYEDPNGSYSGRARVFRVVCGPAPSNYCVGAPNSAGPGALMSFGGTPSLSFNEFRLKTTGVVPSTFGLFYYGANAIQIPFGDGYRCVGAGGVGIFRLGPPIFSTGAGTAERILDFTQPPLSTGAGQVTAGSTWYFQLWYRDAAAGMAGFNYSDGLAVTFCP